ncbi:hypothetical protein ACOMHN_055147 [Nucella lapillus]
MKGSPTMVPMASPSQDPFLTPQAIDLGAIHHHLSSHRERSEGSLTCRNCGKTFSISSNMLRHRRQCEGRGHLQCRHCGKVFSRRDKYKRHLLIRHDECDFTSSALLQMELDQLVVERGIALESQSSFVKREEGDEDCVPFPS